MTDDAPKQFTFYATFGTGQPGFPGYLEVAIEASSEQEAELFARRRLHETVKRWCGLYRSLDDLHELDRVFRGKA